MKALVGAFNQEKALVGAFSVIVQPVVEPMDRFAALIFYFNVSGTFMFRVGTRKLKAKMCTSSGKFETVPIPATYQEPQRNTPQIFLLRT